MIGIGYFADKNNEYMAEMQVNAIRASVAGIDDIMLLKEDSDFSGEKLDNMIEAAKDNKCDNLILLTEEKDFDILSQAVPQIYKGMFDSITVIPENFARIKENDNVASTVGATTVNNQQTVKTNNQQVKQEAVSTPDSANTVAGPAYILCDAIHLRRDAIQEFINTVKAIKGLNIFKNIQQKDWRVSFISSDSGRIDGGAMSSIMEAYPKKKMDLSSFAKQLSKECPDFSLQTVKDDSGAAATLQSFIIQAGIKPQQNTQNGQAGQAGQAGQNGQTTQNKQTGANDAQQPTSSAVNIIAPTEIANYLKTALSKSKLAEQVAVFDIKNLGSNYASFENPNNERIAKLFEELLHTDTELKKGGHTDKDWEEASKQGKNNEDIQTIHYIQVIMEAMKEWGKTDHRKPRAKADTESALAKALKDEALTLADWKGIKADIDGTIFGVAVDATAKIGKAAKQDLDKMKKDGGESLFNEKKTGKRNPVNIFMWQDYDELKKLLIEK